jgi:hypothetical protein
MHQAAANGSAIMSDLLELAMKAHGGLDRWREIKTLDLRMTLTGGLFRIKGYPEGVPNVLMHIDTQRIAVDTSPWTGVGTVGHFIPDRVWITDGERRVVEDRSNPRASFAGHVRATNCSASILLATPFGTISRHRSSSRVLVLSCAN